MSFTFNPDEGYLMPAHFGPPQNLRVGRYQDTTQYVVTYVTDKDTLAAVLPEPFEPADEPIVTISCGVCRGVSFLAGGDYNLIAVNLASVFNGKKDHVVGNFAAILWENDTRVEGRAGIVDEFHEAKWPMVTNLKNAPEPGINRNSRLKQGAIHHDAADCSQPHLAPRNDQLTQLLAFLGCRYQVANAEVFGKSTPHCLERLGELRLRKKGNIDWDRTSAILRVKTGTEGE